MSEVGHPRQFHLRFEHRPGLGGEDFLVAPCNRAAVAWIDRWPDWPGPALAVIGAGASGKTHLASVFTERAAARPLDLPRLLGTPATELAQPPAPLVFDDAETVAGHGEAERALFHLLNALVGARGRLLLTAAAPPARWPVSLRDLASRLAAIPVAAVGAPDDTLMSALVVKLFADRQVRIDADVVGFMVARMERSFAAARALVAAIDARALAEGRAVTVPLVRAVMGAND